jgi:multimeric flavodoxin WrbA
MTTYDAVIMGTPVYWYHVTAQFKMLVDRLYCFLEFGETPETGEQAIKSNFPKRKKFIFILDWMNKYTIESKYWTDLT